MNTIIPNELSFDLDLQELPTRATEISADALNLSGNEYCRYYELRANGGTGGRTLVREYPESKAKTDCLRSCGTVATGNSRVLRAFPGDSNNRGDLYYLCKCCY